MQVGSFGFTEQQRSKIDKMLRLSRRHKYELVAFDRHNLPDLLLISGEESLSSPQLSSLLSDYQHRIAIVSRTKPSLHDFPHISYPLVSSRVLRVLDRFHEPSRAQPKTSPFSSTAIKPPNKHLDLKLEEGGEHLDVLVVDDSRPMRQALADQLNALEIPLDICFADNGLSALEATDKNQFDLIFLDIMMPGIDGFETCTRMRQRPEIKKTPIIMLSSKNSPLDEVKGIMAGCSTYLTKPIVPEEFQKVIRRVSKWITEYQPERIASQARIGK